MKRGEISRRADVHYNEPRYREVVNNLLARYPDAKRLDAYSNVNCGPFGSEITSGDYAAQGVPLLRITNITAEGTIDESDFVFLSEEKAGKLLSTQVKHGDLVISQRGTLGMPAIVPNDYPAYNISANLIGIRNLQGVSADFVQLYLSSGMGASQIERAVSGQVQGKITTEDIASVLVPKTPLEAELVGQMQAARARRAALLADANALLSGIDGYLLNALGLQPPPAQARTTYGVRLSALRQTGHADADFYHPERIAAIRVAQSHAAQGLQSAALRDVVEFVRDQVPADMTANYVGLANVQSGTGELVDTQDEVGGTCFTFQKDDVLFARLRPYLNKVLCAPQSGICSPEFHVMRVKDKAASGMTILPEYLAAVLRSRLVLAQTRHMMTGNTHPRLANEDVTALVIPVPKNEETQAAIVAELARRRDAARQKREEAAAVWADAKQGFVARLLGQEN